MAPATTFGKYQVQRVLGRGGMGTVYEATDPILNRQVALKTMIPGLLGDPGLRARFLREAQAAGSLNHRNIVTVYDLGEDRGQPFIAMEFIEGTDLERIIGAREPFPIEWKVNVLKQVCEGLGHAHRHGIIHRDVKPANIRVTPEGHVKIMDFGIAHLQTPTQLTKGGQVLGTVHYMAPEQIEGGKVDHRADIFAVGAIAYELLTYRRPFDGESLTSIMFKIAHEDPDRNVFPRSAFSPRIEEIVLRALVRDVGGRYQTLQDMGSDLETLLREVVAIPQEPVHPQVVIRWVADGERSLAEADPEAALDFAKRALAVSPADGGAQALARRAEAEALKKRVEKELASIRTEIGRARDQGQLQKALGLAQRLLQLDPDDQAVAQMAAEIQDSIKSLEVDQLCSTALSYAAEGDVDLALKIASKIERIAPSSPKYAELKKYLQEESARRTAEAFVATAREHLGLGNLAEALAAAEEALAACPTHATAREIRERAYHVLVAQSKVDFRPSRSADEASADEADAPMGDEAPAEPAPAEPPAVVRTPPIATPAPPSPQRLEPVAPLAAARVSGLPPVESIELIPVPEAPGPRPLTQPVAPTPAPVTPVRQAPTPAPVASRPVAPTPAPRVTPTPAPMPSAAVARSRTPMPLASAPTPAPRPVMGREDAEALLSDLGAQVAPPTSEPAPRPAPPEPKPATARTASPSVASTPLPTALASVLKPPTARATPGPSLPRVAALTPTPTTPRSPTPAPAATPAASAPTGQPARSAPPPTSTEPPLTPLPEGNPTDAEAARLLEQARRTLRDRQPQKAAPLLEKAAAAEPTHLGIQRLLVQTRIEARKAEIEGLVSSALNHFVGNNNAKARKAVDKVLALDPNNKKAKELAKILGALG